MAIRSSAVRRLGVNGTRADTNGLAKTGERNGALAGTAPREWLLPGGDELFRSLYTRLVRDEPETLAICSAIAGEGKTTVGLGLAVTIAQDMPERRVLLVETDLRQPVLAADFALEPAPGLAEYLRGDELIQSAYRATFLDNLQLVPGGEPTAASSRLLRSSRMASAVAAMRESHDLVLLDVPAVLVSSDALPLADLADGTLFVVRAGVTPRPLVDQALAQLDESKLRGTILNGAHSAIPGWLRRLLGL